MPTDVGCVLNWMSRRRLKKSWKQSYNKTTSMTPLLCYLQPGFDDGLFQPSHKQPHGTSSLWTSATITPKLRLRGLTDRVLSFSAQKSEFGASKVVRLLIYLASPLRGKEKKNKKKNETKIIRSYSRRSRTADWPGLAWLAFWRL